MKRFLAVILALVMVCSFFACEAFAEEKIVIKFAAQGDSTPATQESVDAFNAMQDKYVVEWVDMTNDSGAMKEQLITSMKAGSSDYDVLSMDVCWAGEFAAAGYIEPIDQMMKESELRASAFNAGSMSAASYNAKTFALPFFPDLGVLFFRSDIVSAEDAAVLVSGDYTYADLQAMAEKYKGQGGTTDGICFQAKLGECLMCNLTEYTAGWTDVKGGLEAMKAMVDSSAVPADILNYAESETANSFIKGVSVFSRNWPYQWGEIAANGTITQDQVGVAPLPGGSTVGGWLLGINKNSQNKEGAWEFIKYLATDGQKTQATTGGHLPGYNAMLSDADVIGANVMLSMEGFQNALATTISRPVSSEYSKTADTIINAAHAFLSGNGDLDATAAVIEEALAG
ncbi:MAG: extracellular solute-binding protein [Eubacteriales bacterium]|nr:extracellular solute-binding protein [Eubacteriales bacterium]